MEALPWDGFSQGKSWDNLGFWSGICPCTCHGKGMNPGIPLHGKGRNPRILLHGKGMNTRIPLHGKQINPGIPFHAMGTG